MLYFCSRGKRTVKVHCPEGSYEMDVTDRSPARISISAPKFRGHDRQNPGRRFSVSAKIIKSGREKSSANDLDIMKSKVTPTENMESWIATLANNQNNRKDDICKTREDSFHSLPESRITISTKIKSRPQVNGYKNKNQTTGNIERPSSDSSVPF